MENTTRSFLQLLWQMTGVMGIWGLVGLLLASVIMVIRFIWLMRKDGKSPASQIAPEEAVSLGEVIRSHRANCRMTQEFVAESLGVSRQAVSKWESGASEPSTANLLALAKLFQVDAGEMLKSVRNQNAPDGS